MTDSVVAQIAEVVAIVLSALNGWKRTVACCPCAIDPWMYTGTGMDLYPCGDIAQTVYQGVGTKDRAVCRSGAVDPGEIGGQSQDAGLVRRRLREMRSEGRVRSVDYNMGGDSAELLADARYYRVGRNDAQINAQRLR